MDVGNDWEKLHICCPFTTDFYHGAKYHFTLANVT